VKKLTGKSQCIFSQCGFKNNSIWICVIMKYGYNDVITLGGVLISSYT